MGICAQLLAGKLQMPSGEILHIPELDQLAGVALRPGENLVPWIADGMESRRKIYCDVVQHLLSRNPALSGSDIQIFF